MKHPNPLNFTSDLALAVADYYEYSMAYANLHEGIKGKQAVFELVVRSAPERKYLVNAGLEQAAAYLLEAHGTEELKEYLSHNFSAANIRHQVEFLQWVGQLRFEGNIYAMPEGTIFFPQEPQLRVHERFEEAQVFESLLLNTINPQTNVATTANDIASVTNKILLEGGSRRAGSPQGALFNSRAARIGGFTASSNVAFGMAYDEKVGGTHGHSYVMLHPDEYSAFKAQATLLGEKTCFLLDTYNIENAFETAMKIIDEEKLEHFAFRIDSGDLLSQAKWIHKELHKRVWRRNQYTLIASDDLSAEKIARLEQEGADIDRYLVGTYAVNPSRPLGGVYKMASFENKDGTWALCSKFSEHPGKATLPGIKQVYRVTGGDGFYKKDIVALEGEDVSSYMEQGDTIESLLVPIIKGGRQVYDFPTIDEISERRKEQLSKFRDISKYQVVLSEGVLEAREQVREKYRGGK